MQVQDLWKWMLEDSHAAPVPLEGVGMLLDSAAVSGDSAFIGICFDFDLPGH